MLHYTSLATVLLLISAVSPYHGEYRVIYHQAGPAKHYVIASESYDDYSNFAVAEYYRPNKLPQELHVKIHIYDDYNKDKSIECSLILSPRYNAMEVGVSSLNRLSGKKVVLTWWDELKDHTDYRTTIIVVDVDDYCKKTQLKQSSVSGRVLVVPSSGNKFEVFVNDRHVCYEAAGGRCRISYNLDSNMSGRKRPFNYQFDWSTLKIERLSNHDLVVRGFHGDTYKVIRVYHDGTSSVLMNLKTENRNLQIFSSGTAVCWISNSGENKINCTMYNREDEVDFTKIVEFNEPRELIDVRKIRDNEIMILTKMKRCEDDCWALYSRAVRKDRFQMQDVALPFQCTGDPKELMVFGADYNEEYDNVDFHFACKYENVYNFRTFNIG